MTLNPLNLFTPERSPYILYTLGVSNIVLALMNFSLFMSTINFLAAGLCIGTGIGIHLTADHRRQTKQFWHDAKFFAEQGKKMLEKINKEYEKIKPNE